MLGKWFNFTMIVAMYKYVVSRPVEHSGIDSNRLHYCYTRRQWNFLNSRVLKEVNEY